MTNEIEKMQQQMDQGKAALQEMAPIAARYYLDTRGSGVGRLDALLLTGTMIATLSKKEE